MVDALGSVELGEQSTPSAVIDAAEHVLNAAPAAAAAADQSASLRGDGLTQPIDGAVDGPVNGAVGGSVEAAKGGTRQGTDAPLPCVPLQPSEGAALYWPNKHQNGRERAPESPYAVSDVWSMSWCTDPGSSHVASCIGCKGTLRLTRTVGCDTSINASRMAYDGDAAIIAAAEALGPDDISAWLEGPELLSPLGVHLGNCTYEFAFHATISGTYRVVVVVTRSDWDALDESYRWQSPPSTCDGRALCRRS